jgi:hypothetical protein
MNRNRLGRSKQPGVTFPEQIMEASCPNPEGEKGGLCKEK